VVDEYFSALGKTMSRESELMARVFRHPGKLGENREALLARFLATYLPRRYGIGTGFAMFGSKLSTQQDVVVYDAVDNPVLFPQTTAPLFPPGALGALVEVKSSLSKRELVAAARKATTFKRELRESFVNHPAPPIHEALAITFAFAAALTPARILEILCELEREEEVATRDRLDLVCVLGQGLVLGGTLMQATTRLRGGVAGTTPERLAVEIDNSLFVFYVRLLDYLAARPPTPPQLMSYLPPTTPMGIVTAVA